MLAQTEFPEEDTKPSASDSLSQNKLSPSPQEEHKPPSESDSHNQQKSGANTHLASVSQRARSLILHAHERACRALVFGKTTQYLFVGDVQKAPHSVSD